MTFTRTLYVDRIEAGRMTTWSGNPASIAVSARDGDWTTFDFELTPDEAAGLHVGDPLTVTIETKATS